MMILDGKTINEIKIADDKKAILFFTDAGEIIAKADGDCCSDTWIENIELPALGFPAQVISTEELELGEQSENDDHEFIQLYGFKINTDKGEIIIDFRNESNGYYGGNLSWPGEYFEGGVFGQNISTENWVDI